MKMAPMANRQRNVSVLRGALTRWASSLTLAGSLSHSVLPFLAINWEQATIHSCLRVQLVMQTPPAVRVYGRRGSPQAYAIRDFLQRSDVPFDWVELGTNEQARAELELENLDDSRLPICIFQDGTRMGRPTVRQITEKLGWFRHPSRPNTTSPSMAPGRPAERLGLWRLRGAEDGAGRTLRRRRPGRHQPEDRELSRLSGRDQRRRARRARARASREFGTEI